MITRLELLFVAAIALLGGAIAAGVAIHATYASPARVERLHACVDMSTGRQHGGARAYRWPCAAGETHVSWTVSG